MDKHKKIIELLKREVVPAQGCTEPIAVAYAVSCAVDLIKEEPVRIELYLSTNIIKNALGVGIPGTNGEIGLEIAAALGAVLKNPDKKLELLSCISSVDLEKAKSILDIVNVNLKKTSEKLYIEAVVEGIESRAAIIIQSGHTNIVYIEKDNKVCLDKRTLSDESDNEEVKLDIEEIYSFAESVDIDGISFLLDGAKMNKAVSLEGIEGHYGLMVGHKLLKNNKVNILTNDCANRIIAATAAAADARMGGCPMTIMTCAGSGNQGISSMLPVYELALILDKSEEELIRALAISILVTIHIKSYMGRLSPLCGAGIAGTTGAGCGMVYLLGGGVNKISRLINNMLSDLCGMICDGAKSTCALKIATGVNAAIQCATLAMNNIMPTSKEGIVFDDVEETIKSMDRLVKEGLGTMDDTILSIMLNK